MSTAQRFVPYAYARDNAILLKPTNEREAEAWISDSTPLAALNEVMRVFPWLPGRTHLLSLEVARACRAAAGALATGDEPAALDALREALARDRGSARAWLLLGDALAVEGRREPARQAYGRAAALFPDSPEIAERLAAASDSTRWRGTRARR